MNAAADKRASAGQELRGPGGQETGPIPAWLLALVLGAPVELILSARFSYPWDKGFDRYTRWWDRALCDLWLVAHWPGLKALPRMESRNWGAGSEMLVVFGSGYLILALMLLAAILGWRWVWRRLGAALRQRDAVRPSAH